MAEETENGDEITVDKNTETVEETEIGDDTIVYSRPAQDWSYKAACRHYAFECPNTSKYNIDENVNFIAFRNKGGVMKRVFKIEERLLMNLQSDYFAFLKDESIPQEKKDRVKGYVNEMLKQRKEPKRGELLEEKQILLFAPETISLPNRPTPAKRSNSYNCYYKLGDLKTEDKVELVKMK